MNLAQTTAFSLTALSHPFPDKCFMEFRLLSDVLGSAGIPQIAIRSLALQERDSSLESGTGKRQLLAEQARHQRWLLAGCLPLLCTMEMGSAARPCSAQRPQCGPA